LLTSVLGEVITFTLRPPYPRGRAPGTLWAGGLVSGMSKRMQL